jgi:gluconokinase
MSFRMIAMGPAGCGKTVVGRAVAAALQVEFIDGDDLHPVENVAKMKRGQALTDDDRWPWLDRIANVMAARAASDQSLIVACSALRRIYRDRLRRGDPALRFVFLDAPQDVLERRLIARTGHFMPTSLVASQCATLERPDGEQGVLTVNATASIEDIVREVTAWVRAQA